MQAINLSDSDAGVKLYLAKAYFSQAKAEKNEDLLLKACRIMDEVF